MRFRSGVIGSIGLAVLAVALTAPRATALDPFLAAPEPAGAMEVRLYPTEGVAPGSTRWITFGVPFPRGSFPVAGLAAIRVLRAGAEVPAHVDALALWRHLTDPTIDGASVRIARVQVHLALTAAHPGYESLTVVWGGAARTLDVPALTDPRTGWHTVADGGFLAADGVSEPDVYAVLPKSILARGLLKPTPMDPLADAIAEGRDAPATMDAVEHWPGTGEADRAAKNNFYSLVNRDDPAVTAANRCPFRTDYEPWLYDRAAAMFVLYFRSGFPTVLREAVRNAEFYRLRVGASGFFALKPGDAKYAYNECLAYSRWLTGDDLALAPIAAVVSAHAGTPHKWSPTVGFWTERHTGFKLLANVVAFEVTGGAIYKTATAALLADLQWHQDGAAGAIPADRVDGGLYHYGAQHDGDWADGALGASPWMSVLIADAALRVYALDGAPATAHFLRRLGTFARAAVAVSTDPLYDGASGPIEKSHYALLADGSIGASEYGDEEHALEVATLLAWAHYFSALTGGTDATLKTKADSLYATYDLGVNHWIRPAGPASGLTAYRVSPWRKYGWEHRPSGSLSWLLRQVPDAGPPNLPPTVALTTPTSGAAFAAGESVAAAAAAFDADGSVSKVEFLLDGVEVAEAVAPPFAATLAGVTAGPHTLVATATDDDGATALSAPISFSVLAANLPPTVTLTAPVSGASVPEGTTLVLAATASDADGSVSKVEFFRGTVKLGEDLAAPWSIAWSDASAGSHALRARATDDDGATTDSAIATITVTAASVNVPPTVALTAPVAGAVYEAPATVTLTATASDPDGTVTSVAFYSGTTLVATVGTPPYTATLAGVAAGTWSFSARATDDEGATTASAAVGVTVTAGGGGGGSTAPVTVIFRQGRSGYAGARDVTISTQYLDSTGGEGLTYPTGDLGCFAVAGSGGYEKRTLLRFGDLTLPPGAKVKSAKLTVRAVTWDSGFSVHGTYAATAWNASASVLGWIHRDVGLTWAVPGAGGVGTDRIAGKGFTLSGFKGTGEQSKTVALDPAVVQSWVDSPAANQGVILTNGSVGKVLWLRSSEFATKAHRPTLTIVYEPAPAGGVPTPPPATVTVSYRTGDAGYSGTRDVAVSTLYADEAWNGGHGATFPSGDMPCYEVTGPDGYEAQAWVRFESLGLPAGAKVKSASLTLTFDTWDAGFTIRGKYVAAAWHPDTITWLRAALGLPWSVPGGTGEGSDVLAGKSFAFTGFTATGLDTLTVALDPAVVQTWADTPGANQGVVLVNEHDDKIAKVRASDAASSAHRPLLSITYEP